MGKADCGQTCVNSRLFREECVSARQHLKQMAEDEKMGFLPLLQQLEMKLILNSSLTFQICDVSCFLRRSEKASFRKQKALFPITNRQLVRHGFQLFP